MRKSVALKLAWLAAMAGTAGSAAPVAGTTTSGVGSSLSAKAAAAGVGTGGMAPAAGLKYGLGASSTTLGAKNVLSGISPYLRLQIARDFLRKRRRY